MPEVTLPLLKPANPGNDGRDETRPPVMPYYLMSTVDGLSHIARHEMSGFKLKSVGGGAAPQWLRDDPGEVADVKFAVLPVGWIGEWHESPKPQWVIPLAGRWFLESADGQRVEMGPGDIHYGEDQNTLEKKGHRSGTVGDEPCVQMMVQFRSRPE